MTNFVDREPTQPGRRKITHEDGTSEYVTISMADNPDVAGTPLNRAAMMALQGFEKDNISISKKDGVTTIIATNANGEKTETTISKTSGITTINRRFKGNNNISISTKTVISSENGITNITKEVNG